MTADLDALPAIPRDAEGPVFRAPWEAQAFGMAVMLHERGHFTWKEWAARLSDEIGAAKVRGEQDDGSRYYYFWLAALEILKTGDVQRELNRKGDRLREGMNQVLKTRGVTGCVYGASSIFRIHLGASAEELGLPTYTMDATRLDRGMGPVGGTLHLAMLLNGVDYSRGASHGWMNGAMGDKDVDTVIEAFDRSLVRLGEDKRL